MAEYIMNKDLLERLNIIGNMVWEIQTYQDMVELFSDNLHISINQAQSNQGLYFILRSLMALNILTLSKLLNEDGSYSFQKIINIASRKISTFDKDCVQHELNETIKEFQSKKLDVVRDKFIAHLDYTVPEIRTGICDLNYITNQTTDIYQMLVNNLKVKEYIPTEPCLKDLQRFFAQQEEYVRLRTIICDAQKKGKSQISLSKLI